MIPLGMDYRALHDIKFNGCLAYAAGHLVHASAVTGDGAWLTLGTDVEAVAGAQLDPPARNATQGEWAAFMAALVDGLSADKATGMSRADLIAMHDKANPGNPAPDGSEADSGGDGDLGTAGPPAARTARTTRA